ncbi:hypothetical protein AVEN_22519-1 [Araneus ventricosus]|uniref:Uncharacterized protein n=1 Tax=Araneus ventricosus TaxID=182803 RepID=A0A4Y2S628_ARAVE|nr:hypothetical protein AVEN_22519-1 [Araneus ventricosus]
MNESKERRRYFCIYISRRQSPRFLIILVSRLLQVVRSGRRTDKGTWQTMAALSGLPLQEHAHQAHGQVEEDARQGAPGHRVQVLAHPRPRRLQAPLQEGRFVFEVRVNDFSIWHYGEKLNGVPLRPVKARCTRTSGYVRISHRSLEKMLSKSAAHYLFDTADRPEVRLHYPNTIGLGNFGK